MIAYTGIETVSNLAEEARDPARTIPASIRLVAIAVFAIYFTLPLVALSAMPVEHVDGEYLTKLGLPPEQGGFENDPVLGLVENLGLHGAVLSRDEDLRRRPRGDDPLHRHERRRDRRVADHLLDGELPAAARGLPPAAPAVQDAVALARRLRRVHLDPRHPAGQDGLPRDDVLVRRDALVHDRARVDRRATRPTEATPRSSSGAARTCGWGASRGRCSRSSAGSAPASPGSSSSSRTRRRAGPGSAGWRSGFVFYAVYRRRVGARAADADRARAGAFGPALALEYRRILVPVVTGEPRRGARRRLRAGRRARAQIVAFTVIEVPLELPLDADLPGRRSARTRELDEAQAIGDRTACE